MMRAEALSKACTALGLTFEAGYVVKIDENVVLKTVGRIRELGDDNGMLVLARYDEVEPFTQRLADLGYGFSVLGEPKDAAVFDLDGYKRIFRDWGWSGALGSKPSWM
jgi:hypothetical protein